MTTSARPWTFVLAPIDQGTRNVGGRAGASQAPKRLLDALRDEGLVPSAARVREVPVGNDAASLEGDLDAVSEAVEEALAADRLPIVLGGDHGTTYATARGAARALGEVGVAYLDVHLDVRDYRPRHTSGSSFRRLIEEGWVEAEHVRGLGIREPGDPHASSGSKASFAELRRWADEHGLAWTGLEALAERPAEVLQDALVAGPSWCCSLDVDVLDERWAPGVSAPGEGRLSLSAACEAARAARGGYRVLDIVEFAPPLDEDERTLASCVELLEAALPEPPA